jgi:hypothetical protein
VKNECTSGCTSTRACEHGKRQQNKHFSRFSSDLQNLKNSNNMGQGLVSKYAFIPPTPTYDGSERGFLWIPRKERERPIPAFLVNAHKPKAIILFTHGNAEDIGSCLTLVCFADS